MQVELKDILLDLLIAFQSLPASRHLPSSCGGKSLLDDLSKFIVAVIADDFDIERMIPLLQAVLVKESDYLIWDKVYTVVTESTPPPRPLTTPPRSHPSFPSYAKDTPNHLNSGRLQNTSEPVEKVRDVLRCELNSNLELDHPEFDLIYLAVPQVVDAATAVFEKCREGEDPLYTTGDRWRGWEELDEKGVQRSLEECISKLMEFLDEAGIESPSQRRFVSSPNTPIPGPVKRKPDLCVATFAGKGTGVSNKQVASWRQVLIPIELKSLGHDGLENTWSDIMKFAREIFRHQDSRRFVLGLTLCGSTLRLWEFDRIGATTSVAFDIHQNGLFFVKTLLSFLWMNDEQLGFDSDLMELNGKRFVKINREGKEERLIITGTLRDHTACIAGRATTCWKAYREGDDSKKPLVVKDSWQYINRPEEGELIRKATAAGVTNISQYYHHATVLFNGKEDYVRSNVRNSMSTKAGSNPFTQPDFFPPKTTAPNKAYSTSKVVNSSQGPDMARSSQAFHSPVLTKTQCASSFGSASQQSQTSRKRSSTQIKAPEPARKRLPSGMAAEKGDSQLGNDRVRRRVITQNVGKPLRQASCTSAIITGLLGGIKG